MEFAFKKQPCGTPMHPDDMPPDWYINLVENFHYLYFGIFVKSFPIFLNLCLLLSSKIYFAFA